MGTVRIYKDWMGKNMSKITVAILLLLFLLSGCSSGESDNFHMSENVQEQEEVNAETDQTKEENIEIKSVEDEAREAIRELCGEQEILQLLWCDDGVTKDYYIESGEIFSNISTIGRGFAVHSSLWEEIAILDADSPPSFSDGYLVFMTDENIPDFFFDAAKRTLYYAVKHPDYAYVWVYEREDQNEKYLDLLMKSRSLFEDELYNGSDEEREWVREKNIPDNEMHIKLISLGVSGNERESTTITVSPSYTDEYGTEFGGYYSLEIPESWMGKYICECSPMAAYGYSTSFYSKEDRDDGYDGHLFTLSLFDELTDYSYLPDFQKIGHLEVYRIGAYDLVAIWPTDVQFAEDNAKQYQEMSAEIEAIIGSIKFSDEVIFTK